MIPKAPIQAQIIIGLFAVLTIAYVLSIVRLNGTATGTRSVVPGQVIVVRIERPSILVKTSNQWVVAPLSATGTPQSVGYFVAVKPGHATLSAVLPPPCRECLSPTLLWRVDVIVWPSG
jgi:hypothetical protein